MIELLLRSAGAPASAVELVRLIMAEGFGAFSWTPIAKDDAAWTKIGSDPSRSHVGFWVRAEGTNSRITAAIFMEGVNDDAVQMLTSVAGLPALNS